MKTNLVSLAIFMSLLLAACASAGKQPTQTTSIAPVIAEGRVEPIYFAGIAFTTSGVISEVLVREGETVTNEN